MENFVERLMMMKSIGYLILLVLAANACGKKRPVHHLIENELRIEKSALDGEFYFLKTVTKVDTPGFGIGEYLFPGTFLEQGNIVKFDFKEHRMDIVAVENPLDSTSPRESSAILASFPVEHVDILWQKNSDDKDTRIEEETVSRNSWESRGYVVIDTTNDTLDTVSREFTRTTTAVDRLEYDPITRTLNFELEKNLTDGTIIRQKYSFMTTKSLKGYEPQEYSVNETRTFGFFDTITYSFNEYGRVTDKDLKRYINRRNPQENIVYYLSEGYPEKLIDETKKVFEAWNDVFEEATGRRFLELKGNAGEKMGDMRYNMIYYVDDRSSKSILGYGPSYSNPKTGQILKADVFLYGATLKNAIYGERQWIDTLDDKAALPGGDFSLTAISENSPLKALDPMDSIDPAAFDTLKAAYTLDEKTVDSIQKSFQDVGKVLEKMRGSDLKDYRKITRLTTDVLSPMRKLALAEELSDDELEIKIFGPLLAHEMGHNFGLRHNFMGSADSEYQTAEHGSSSVMDYTFLTSKSDGKPGAYDMAAISFAYGNEEKKSASLKKSFFFCTDEDLLSSRSPLCAQFDWGTTLTDVVKNQFEKYSSSYQFNNLRGDRAFFSENIEGYINSIFNSLIPFRLVIDNANAISEMVNTDYEPGKPSETALFSNLWELLGKKIEADDTSATANTVEIEISEGVKKKFDIAKIQGLATDADNAKTFAISSLEATVLETSRSNYNGIDPFNRQLSVRGVLFDKLIALIVLAQDTADPLGRGSVASAFTDKEEEIGSLFVQIISNSRKTTTGRELSIWDVNLRRMALNLLRELTLPGKQTSEMIELLSLLEFDPPTAAVPLGVDLSSTELTAYNAVYLPTTGHDDKIKNYIVQSLAATVTQAQIDVLRTNIQTETTARNLVNFASVKVKDRFFKTPITLDVGGLALTSATGLLIRDTLNQLDIRVTAYQEAITALGPQITAEVDPTRKVQLGLLRESYQQTQIGFRRFVNQEKRLIEEIYSIYHPNR
jgi:hypothetical protein